MAASVPSEQTHTGKPSSLKYLPEFIAFLERNHFHEYIKEILAAARAIDLPLLAHFAHMPEEELLALSAEGHRELFSAIADNDLEKYIERSNKRWLANQLPIVARNEIAIDDASLYSFVRKKCLIKYIRQYPVSVDIQFALIEELDQVFLTLDIAANRTFVSILIDALLTTESKLEEAQEIAGLGSYEWVVGTRLIKGSKQFCKIFDWDGSSANLDLKSKIHPDDADRVNAAITLSASSMTDFDCEYRILTGGGEKVVWSRGRLTEIDGQKVIKGTLMDVTEKSRMIAEIKETEYLFKHAQAISRIGNFKWTFSDNTLWWSDEMYNIYGLDKSETLVPYESTRKCVHPDDAQLIREKSEEAIRLKRLVEVYFRITSGKGEEKTLRAQCEPGLDMAGKPFCLYGTVQDVTLLIQTEKQLEELNNKLERSNANLQDFAYVVSHDLKEPLRKIIAFSQILSDSERDTLSRAGADYLARIVNASERMQRLIDDILTLSLVSHNRQFEQTNLQEVLEEVLQILEHKIEEGRGIVTSGELPSAEIIPAQFRQLFQNLISNSLKFCQEEVPPRIDISAAFLSAQQKEQLSLNTERAYMQLTFADNGIGFSNDDAGKIFEAFQRLHGRSEYDGSGIGLAVCRKIAEQHNGFITASGIPGEGAVFTIVIPVRQEELSAG